MSLKYEPASELQPSTPNPSTLKQLLGDAIEAALPDPEGEVEEKDVLDVLLEQRLKVSLSSLYYAQA